ncbi:hypothetical protein Bca4012_068293 [Brassica carinata]
MRSISTPMSVFEFGFRASQKCIRRNRNSSSCGPIVTSLKNITSSRCAEEDRDLGMAEKPVVLSFGLIAISEVATDFPLGFSEIAEEDLGMAEETVVLSVGLIAISEVATDFPLGFFETAEEERFFRFGCGSSDTGDLPVDSIAVES